MRGSLPDPLKKAFPGLLLPVNLVNQALRMPSFHKETRTRACIFCEIVAGRAPASLVGENSLSIAVLDTGPLREGHTPVIRISSASACRASYRDRRPRPNLMVGGARQKAIPNRP